VRYLDLVVSSSRTDLPRRPPIAAYLVAGGHGCSADRAGNDAPPRGASTTAGGAGWTAGSMIARGGSALAIFVGLAAGDERACPATVLVIALFTASWCLHACDRSRPPMTTATAPSRRASRAPGLHQRRLTSRSASRSG
jgi:hypothetical protein